MQTGRFNPISINQVLANAKLMLGLEATTQNDLFLLMKINEGAMHLYNNDQKVMKFCDVDIIEGAACLPNGFENIIGVVFLNEEGCECDIAHTNSQVFQSLSIYTTNPFTDQPYYTSAIRGGHLIFNTPCDIPYDKVRIYFIGRNVDQNGVTVVYEMQERGLTAYACYQYALKYPKRYERIQIDDWKTTWVSQKRFLNGKANVDYWQENKERIGSLFTSWLVFKSYGQI